MSALKNDGSVKYGSMTMQVGAGLGGTGTPDATHVVYVADNIELTRATGAILRTNEIGEPSGRVLYKNDVDSFTCTLQFATSSTPVPVLGWETTITALTTTLGGGIWYLDKLGVAYTKDGETKINATFVELLVTHA